MLGSLFQFGEKFLDRRVDLLRLFGGQVVLYVSDNLETRALDASLDELHIGWGRYEVIGAGKDQRGVVDFRNLIAQIHLGAGNHIGVAHPWVGFYLLAPALANEVEFLFGGLGRVAIGGERLRRTSHRDRAHTVDAILWDVELGRRRDENQRLHAIRIAHREIHRDRTAHRAPGDYGRIDLERVEKCRDEIRVTLNRVQPLDARSPSMPGQVERDRTVLLTEVIVLIVPCMAVVAGRMQHHDLAAARKIRDHLRNGGLPRVVEVGGITLHIHIFRRHRRQTLRKLYLRLAIRFGRQLSNGTDLACVNRARKQIEPYQAVQGKGNVGFKSGLRGRFTYGVIRAPAG